MDGESLDGESLDGESLDGESLDGESVGGELIDVSRVDVLPLAAQNAVVKRGQRGSDFVDEDGLVLADSKYVVSHESESPSPRLIGRQC